MLLDIMNCHPNGRTPGFMNVRDYLIDQSGKDWSELLSGWSDALPPSFTVWLVNRFGDVFGIFEDGALLAAAEAADFVLILCAQTNRLADLTQLVPAALRSLNSVEPGQVIRLR